VTKKSSETSPRDPQKFQKYQNPQCDEDTPFTAEESLQMRITKRQETRNVFLKQQMGTFAFGPAVLAVALNWW